jgi:tetratricopeptide (TPR) repeat protein
MRSVIADQIAEGRTPDQVREWFVARYGEEVLRTPHNAASIMLWAAPLAVAIAAAIAAVFTIRRRRIGSAKPSGESVFHRRAVFLSVSGVLIVMVAAVGVAGWWVERPTPAARSAPTEAAADQPLALARTMESQGDFAAAADLYREAVTARPDPAIRLRLAFALLRAHRADEALPIAEQAQAQTPTDPDALLILGLVQRAAGQPEAYQTLSRFLEAAPDHPAAQEVRAVLERNRG